MSAATFNEAGPEPPLGPEEYLQCREQQCLSTFDSQSDEMPVEHSRGQAQCPVCESFLGFNRRRRGLSIAERWPGAKAVTMLPDELYRHLGTLGLDPFDLALLGEYERHRWGGPERVAYPSVRRAAERLGVSERAARKHIDGMVAKGYLEKYERKNADGGNAPFGLTRVGLSKVVAYIAANEVETKKGVWAVPGLEEFLQGLRPSGTSCNTPPASVATPSGTERNPQSETGESEVDEAEPLTGRVPEDGGTSDDPDFLTPEEFINNVIHLFDAVEEAIDATPVEERDRTICAYGHHASSDWIAHNGRRQCGICHPPAVESLVSRWVRAA